MEKEKILEKSVRYIKGVGEEKEKLLNKLNIYTLEDLINYFPRTYQDRRNVIELCECIEEESQLVEVVVSRPVLVLGKGRKKIYKLYGEDKTGKFEATWFNMPYIKNMFCVGKSYKFYGKVKIQRGTIMMNSPVFDQSSISKNTGYIVPIYRLTSNLTQNKLRAIIANAFSMLDQRLEEHIPDDIIQKYKLMELNEAVYNMHFPKDEKAFLAAKRRLAFDELFLTSIALLKLKQKNKSQNSIVFSSDCLVDEFIKTLPFSLTNAQNKVIMEIQKDMESNISMNRLVQGDVGSGKTVVAIAALYKCVKSNYQGVIMAPTAILATQHYENFKKMLDSFGICCELLISGISKKKKMQILEDLENGKIDILIGTHAILEDNVKFHNLGLVVTDEQHRFGVKQREKLNKKTKNCDTIVMSATPIPRTLGLILYGDLDISIIDELPPNRKQIQTYAVKTKLEDRAYGYLAKQLDQGRQGYIVCPLVEQNEELEIESVNELYEKLTKTVLKNYEVKIMHGKLKEKEKNQIMEDFKCHKIDVLISTTVIEVGVDVPNANIMIVKDAQRFGLAQLHQLRGRVGRGSYESFCILIYESTSNTIDERMKIMCKTNDGFEISQKDLEIRGTGDFFGTAQHGIPEFKVANLFTDSVMLKYAQMEAKNILDSNVLDSNINLLNKINKFFEGKINI